MSSTPKSTLDLFGQTYEQIIQKTLGKSNSKFQLAYPFIDWTWPTPSAGYIDPTAYTYVGRVPQWSAIGQSYRPTDTDLHSAYLTMLLHCPKLTLTPEQQQQLTQADSQIRKCETKRDEDRQRRNRAWDSATNNLPQGVPKPEWNQWVVDSGWSDILAADKAAIAKATETKIEIVAQQNPQYKEALAAATPPKDTTSIKPGFVLCFVAPGQEEVRPNYFLGKDGSDWIAQLTEGGGFPITVQLSASIASSALQKSWAEGTIEYNYGFFSVYSNNEWKQFDIHTQDQSVRVSIDIKAVTQVPVAPDDAWYNSGYLKFLASKHKWNSPFTTTGGESPVFGKGGLLPLIVTGMVAGYQPNFKITMSSETFQQHKSDFTTCDGIRIGPFQFGGSGSGGTSADTWSHSASNNTFSGKSTAKYPFIMGFIVAEPGLDD